MSAWVNPLLQTKLHPPTPRPGGVARPRLTARLPSAAGRRLTLISAAAGSGKTTLLAEWRAQSPGSAAWLTLDADDNDPARFWTYIISALRRLDPALGDAALAQLRAPQTGALSAALSLLLNDLADYPVDFCLVLDDYHVIETPAIHSGMQFLIEQAPPTMSVIIASRVDPPLPLARWRARGQLAEVRAADLRFTVAEAAAFLNSTLGLALPAEQVAALEARTEGWIAGLQLVALSMQGLADPAAFVAAFTGSHRHIMDFLTEEVLQRQPEAARRFLLETAIVDRLCGPLCEALTAEAGGQARLEALERANLFLVPLDEERRWYRYHHLFAELLRARLRQEQPEHWADLQRRAPAWFESQGLIPEAVAHALAAPDPARAGRLMDAAFLDLWRRGQAWTLLRWVEALPEALAAEYPSLEWLRAWAAVYGDRAVEAERRLAAVAERLDREPAAQPTLRGLVLTYRVVLAGTQGDRERVLELAGQAQTVLAPDDLNARASVAHAVAFGHRFGGETQRAAQAAAQALALAQAAGNLYTATAAQRNLGQIQRLQGRLREAHATYQQALRRVEEHLGPNSPLAGLINVGLAELFYEQAELAAAERLAREGAVAGERSHLRDYLFTADLVLAQTLRAHGDLTGAWDALEAAGRHAPHARAASLAAAHRARMQVWEGQLTGAGAWAAAYARERQTARPYLRETEDLTLARCWLALGQPAEALELARATGERAQQLERGLIHLEALVVEALAWQALGQTPRAGERLAQALRLGAPEGFRRLYDDEGEALKPVLTLARSRLEKDSAPAAGPSARPVEPPALFEPLTEREAAVLRRLAAGLSNPEIARELYLSVDTIKTHLRGIYGKLGVHNRTQAILQAQALGLL